MGEVIASVCVANLQQEAEDSGLEPPAEGGRTFQPLSYSSSSDAFDEESSVILMMMPVRVRVRTRVISRANLPVEAGKGVLHNHSAQMQFGRSHQQK